MSRTFYLIFALLLIFALPAPAPQVTGVTTGTVTDPSGSAIAGAAVKLISAETGAIRDASTDAEGNFVFTAVKPGIYTVSAEHTGVKKRQKSGLHLPPGGNLAAGNLKLDVGAVSESVEVRAEGAMVQTASSER